MQLNVLYKQAKPLDPLVDWIMQAIGQRVCVCGGVRVGVGVGVSRCEKGEDRRGDDVVDG